MACYHPQRAYRSRAGRSATGGWPIVFDKRQGYEDMVVEIPCGHCIGCKLEYSRQWANRMSCELRMHDDSCYSTLTYNDEEYKNLCRGSLDKKELSGFIKRLRERVGYEKLRYFGCGEYGDEGRAHYHVILFGLPFKSEDYLGLSKTGHPMYCNDSVQKSWNKGFTFSEEVTYESCAYVSRYVTKKLSGERVVEYGGRVPEFALMSRRPGIGKAWAEKYFGDLASSRKLVIRNGVECRIPRYFEKIVDEKMAGVMKKIKRERREYAIKNPVDFFGRYNIEEAILHDKKESRSTEEFIV